VSEAAVGLGNAADVRGPLGGEGPFRLGERRQEQERDATLGVHGAGGWRIADVSVMLAVPSGNRHAAVLMIAERLADFTGGSRALLVARAAGVSQLSPARSAGGARQPGGTA